VAVVVAMVLVGPLDELNDRIVQLVFRRQPTDRIRHAGTGGVRRIGLGV